MDRRGVILAACAGAIAIVACRQLVGLDDERATAYAPDAGLDGSADAAPPVCSGGLTSLGAGCQQCIDKSCCGKSQACEGAPACKVLEGCLFGCAGDPACRSQCALASQVATVSEIPAIAACAATNCFDACNLACGGSLTFIPPDAAADCQTCAIGVGVGDGGGCNILSECNEDSTCLAILNCHTACVTDDCRAACTANDANDAGLSDYVNLVNAGFNGCASACAFGNDWSCVGHITWPLAKATTIKITLGFSDYPLSTVPVSNVDVKICNAAAGGSTCDQTGLDPASDTGTTDANGNVVLSETNLKTNAVSQSVFFDLSGSPVFEGSSEGDQLFPTLYYPGFPFSEPQAALLAPVPITTAAQFQKLLSGITGSDAGADASLGHLALLGYDCISATSPGLTFALTGVDAGAATPFYFTQSGLSSSKLSTDESGFGGFFNVPPGDVMITATNSSGNVVLVESAYVRAGAVTIVAMHPTP